MKSNGVKSISLEEQITHLLNEIRIVLPGTQTLLGFQFAAVFTERFHTLAYSLRLMHIGSLSCIALAVIFLLAAPAFNRIVQQEKATQQFHRFASRMVLSALIFLAFGLALDMYVVVLLGIGSAGVASVLSISVFMISLLLWFGYTLYSRRNLRA